MEKEQADLLAIVRWGLLKGSFMLLRSAGRAAAVAERAAAIEANLGATKRAEFMVKVVKDRETI